MSALLHIHSEFSARDSLLRVHEIPKLAKSLGWNACAITDHGAVEGVLPFKDACDEHGVKMIAGAEVYISTPDSEKYHHLTLLAKNAKGWSAIGAVLSAATEYSVGNKRRLTACPIHVALDVLHDVVVLSGCFSSPFWRITREADISAGRPDLERWIDKFKDDFFFEVQPLDDWSEQIRLNRLVLETAKNYKRPVVVTPDCHFGTAEDGLMHDALLALAHRAVLGSGDDTWKFSTKLNYLMTPEVVVERLSRAGFTHDEAVQAVLMTDRVAERIEDWSFDDLSPSAIPILDGDFAEMTRAAFNKRAFAGEPEYMDRLEEELRVFTTAGLGNYFLLVCECLKLFREQGAMIGPRGSVGGSLIAYVLGIGNLDPVVHNMPYWRFWYPGRAMPGAIGPDGKPVLGPDGKPIKGSPPDIDIDLGTVDHKKVGPLLRERFGADKVAQISTIGTFGTRSAVRAAAKTFGVVIPDRGEWEEDKALRAGATEDEKREALYTIPLFHELPLAARTFAERLVGRVEKFGAHPGGFVIAAESLAYGRSCIVRRGKGTAMCWDMEAAEKLGFLKIDFLGNASIDALQVLSKIEEVEDLEAIPLDDPAVLRDFREGRTAGIPQFSTSGMRTFTEMVGPKNFQELVWINAAFRKGAIVAAGSPREMATAYRERPDSVIVYQEELMRFCRELAGLSWEDTDKIRKIVAKSKGTEELLKWQDKFVNGCERIGVLNREEANVLWSNLKSAGEYLFGISHASSYSANAFRIAWLKRHDPPKAFAALLNLAAKPEDREPLLDEAHHYKVKVVPPNPNKSGFIWTVEGSNVLAPLQYAEGADMRVAKAIALRRSVREVKKGKKTVTVGGLFKDLADFTARMGKPGKMAYRGKDGKTKYKSTGIGRPDWFDHRLWNPAPRRTEKPSRPDATDAQAFREVVKECKQCSLRATCKAPVPPEFGKTNVLVLGQSPGKYEDSRGKPFVGRSGELLFNTLEAHGIERQNVSIFNVISCLPVRDEKPPDTCAWADKWIDHFKPPLVLAVGKPAWQRVSGMGEHAPGIMKMNGTLVHASGWSHPFGIVPCVHPAAVLRDMRLIHELDRAVGKFARLFEASLV